MLAAPAARADVILVEIPSTTLPAAGTFKALSGACAPAHVLVLAPALGKSQITDLLREGVHGIVIENVDAAALIKSLQSVASGRYWLAPERMAELVQALAGATPAASETGGAAAFKLTPRELEIISLVAAGDGNKSIARACGISEKTVKHHLTNVFDKLGVSSRLELAVFALEHHIVGPGRHSS